MKLDAIGEFEDRVGNNIAPIKGVLSGILDQDGLLLKMQDLFQKEIEDYRAKHPELEDAGLKELEENSKFDWSKNKERLYKLVEEYCLVHDEIKGRLEDG